MFKLISKIPGKDWYGGPYDEYYFNNDGGPNIFDTAAADVENLDTGRYSAVSLSAGLKDSFIRFNRRLPEVDADILKNKLADSRAVFIFTGQQTGLAGGPLYTVYKALTAVGLAAQMESVWGTPVIPVFWCATEDHDLSEISRLCFPGPEPLRLKLDLPEHRMPAGRIPVLPEYRTRISEAIKTMRETEFSGPLHSFIEGALLASKT